MAIAGDSAGGCLALQVLQHARDTGLPLPRAMVLIGPIGDLSGDVASRFEAAGDEILIPPEWPERIPARLPARRGTGTDPAVSPLAGDLTGLPPTLIQAGAGEALAGDRAAHRGRARRGHARAVGGAAACLASSRRPHARRRPRRGPDRDVPEGQARPKGERHGHPADHRPDQTSPRGNQPRDSRI